MIFARGSRIAARCGKHDGCFVFICSSLKNDIWNHRHQVQQHQQQQCRRFSKKETQHFVSIMDHLDELHKIPLADVRNFCIIAHVDHGKSSLASRLLEYTGNLGHDRQLTAHQLGERSIDHNEEDESATIKNNHTYKETGSKSTATQTSKHKEIKEEITLLDTLKVERERGITVKASAASMLYKHPSATNDQGWILLNMVDTPGHADFGQEVSKSLESIEGAVLLFDSVQGVQAQTLSVYDKARALGKQILPALTKIDIPSARPLEVALAVSDLFAFDPDSILKTSARAR